MPDRSDALAYFLLKQELEEFLYHEAELLDERRYAEWLALLADDVRYWMPMRRNVKFGELEREFTREGLDINWFDEGKETLTRHVRPSVAEPAEVTVKMPLPHLPQPGGNGDRPPGGEEPDLFLLGPFLIQ